MSLKNKNKAHNIMPRLINASLITCLLLGGCATQKSAQPLSAQKLTEGKGVLAFTIGHKTENPSNSFPDVDWKIVTKKYTPNEDDPDKREFVDEVKVVTLVSSSDLENTDKKDYKQTTVAYIYDEGEHLPFYGSSLYQFIKTLPQERHFKIKSNSITYIGDFVYESNSSDKGLGNDMKRLLLKVKCDSNSFSDIFRKTYPAHKEKEILDACVNEGKFRRHPANGSVRMHIQYTPATAG